MIYLIIPIICFVLIAGLFWVLMSPSGSERKLKGKIDDLAPILSVLMTSVLDERYLLINVHTGVTWLKISFRGSAMRMEVPLGPYLQQSRRESYLAICRDLKLDAHIASNRDDYDLLQCEIEGPIDSAPTVIENVVIKLLEVNPDSVLEFRVFADIWDQSVIERAVRETRSEDSEDLPIAATQSVDVERQGKARAGCMLGLAGVFLLPLPFMIAFLEFGYIAASAVLVMILISREIYRRWKSANSSIRITDFLKLMALFLVVETIYLNDPFYLQVLPTAILILAAIAELVAVAMGVSYLSVAGQKSGDFTITQRKLLSFSIVATCVGGAAMNEFLRANITLDGWMWYFAFFRLELLIGFLVTSMPLIINQVRQDGNTESDTAK